MRKLTKKRTKKAGLPSGTLVYTGEKRDEQVKIHVIDFDEANFQEIELVSVDACIPSRGSDPPETSTSISGRRNTTASTARDSSRCCSTFIASFAATLSGCMLIEHVGIEVIRYGSF